ncbi:MAG: Rpn family recombination-promoting nuclease/putative transposase [Bacilli bacterium]|nr:Rpn family recombination-promoting nuclease/putative transposase [Bacilli bacterium]
MNLKNRVEITKLKEGEKPSILSNTMFKTMFYHSDRIKYSAKLLSYYLDISYEDLLNNIKLVKNELDKEKNDSKEERCDYVCEIRNTKINIEVNNNEDISIMERNMEYAHRLYAEKIKIGEDYKYKYNQVIQINLNNFSFEGNDKIVDIYSIQNDEGIVLNNKIVFIQLYIPKLREKWYNEGIENLREEERYLLGLVEPNIDDSLELGGDIELMIEYVNAAGEVSMGTNFGESYDKEWAIKDQGIREGRREGIKEGIKKGQREIVLKMIENGMDVESISKVTELSIEKIQEIIQ